MTTTTVLERFSLRGKVALVTGASRGIGRAIALALAEAGADLALASRTEADLKKTAESVESSGVEALCLPTDVTAIDQVRRMVRDAITHYGKLDILVNAAGVPHRGPTTEISEDDFDRIYSTNIKSVTFASAAAGRHFVERGTGSIINICSLTTTIGLPGRALYGPTKGAVGQLTKALAVEWGPSGVRVNAIAPGWIVTDLSRGALDDPAWRSAVIGRTPLGRLGYPEDVAPAAVFLASDAASFITGEILTVDGGFLAG